MRDPYSILGVNKNADQKEIKAAWRATAKALHPDQNPDDPKAVGRFTEAGRAYDLLKDPDKRRLFDEAAARSAKRAGKEPTFMEQRAERARAEAEAKAAAMARAAAEARAAAAAAAVDAQNAAAQEGRKKSNAEDVVSRIFGTRKSAETSEQSKASEQPKAQPQPEAAQAARSDDQTPPASERTPEKQPEPASHEPQPSPARELMAYLLKRLTRQVPPPEKAPDLNADVNVSIEDILHRLNPAVTLPDGKLVSIPLPEAVNDGTQIRVEGYGHRLPNLKRGDVVATVRIKPHRWYRVDGYDLRTSVDIDIDKAVLGGEVTVETPDGSQKVTIPPWSGSQYTARIAGRGLPNGPGSRGDLIAEMRVMLWDRPDQKLIDLMRSLRDGLYL